MAATYNDIANMGDLALEREDSEFRRRNPGKDLCKTTDDPKLEARKKKLQAKYHFPD